MSNKNITVKELLQKINEDLATKFAKDIINLGYNKYDTTNGRSTVSLHTLRSTLQNETGLDFYEERNNLTSCGNTLVIKTKRKKSGMIDSWNHTEKMTIIEIYVENEEILNKTIETIENERNIARKAEREAFENGVEQKKKRIVDTLTKCNMSLNEFKSLMNAYRTLGGNDQDELDTLMNS